MKPVDEAAERILSVIPTDLQVALERAVSPARRPRRLAAALVLLMGGPRCLEALRKPGGAKIELAYWVAAVRRHQPEWV